MVEVEESLLPLQALSVLRARANRYSLNCGVWGCDLLSMILSAAECVAIVLTACWPAALVVQMARSGAGGMVFKRRTLSFPARNAEIYGRGRGKVVAGRRQGGPCAVWPAGPATLRGSALRGLAVQVAGSGCRP
ncbi:hypothetical protein GCM10028811_38160 [Uliginosibacterium sediminicola]